MGAKTWMLVYSDGNAIKHLSDAVALDQKATDNLVEKLYPYENLESIPNSNLAYTSPSDTEIFAGIFGNVTVLAAKEFGGDYPSQLDQRFIDSSIGSHITLHAMHSAADWFAYAKWENSTLVRSLSLSPDSGILEDIGDKFRFELPYWNGEHGDDELEEVGYPFPFHPIELGEEALKKFFGYQLEGKANEHLLHPEKIPLLAYKRVNPWWKLW